ncbi:MAG: glycosyltransferase family 1 protein, partial [Actinobacteria bacterium]
REWGYRVGIVCATGSGLEAVARSQEFEVMPLSIGARLPGSTRRLARLFVSAAPDIVHAHGFHAIVSAAPAARRSGVPMMLATVHSMPGAALALRPGLAGRIEFAFRSWLYHRAAPNVDRFVCVVTAARDELLGSGIDSAKLTVIANGIPDPAVSQSHVAHASEYVLAGSVGRMEAPKGFAEFIDAAAMAADANGGVRFRLVGDGSMRATLERRVAEYSLGERLDFAGWSDSPLHHIAEMDIYVSSSLTETTNLTVLEAMGLGKPVVATDVGGVADAIVEGVNGYLVPARRPDLLAERIVGLAADAQLRARMGAEGRARYERLFTEDRMLEQHRALYERYRSDATKHAESESK